MWPSSLARKAREEAEHLRQILIDQEQSALVAAFKALDAVQQQIKSLLRQTESDQE